MGSTRSPISPIVKPSRRSVADTSRASALAWSLDALRTSTFTWPWGSVVVVVVGVPFPPFAACTTGVAGGAVPMALNASIMFCA